MSNPSLPRVVTTVSELREQLQSARREGKTIGLVPTMGALHAGHLSLVQASRAECDVTVATIFVNPSQFGPNEDFARYPRTLAADMELLAGEAQWVFAPRDDDVYLPGHATWVDVQSVTRLWEGAARPGHFRGVATIVLKLFNMAQPDRAYFGQKDYQQALLIRRMVADLDVPVTVRVCPIVREPDGLAMSSRNRYLNPSDRRQAASLFASLCVAQELLARGEREPATIEARVRQTILAAGAAQIDYVAIADPETLEPVARVAGQTLIALAVKIGNTRLIDNIILETP